MAKFDSPEYIAMHEEILRLHAAGVRKAEICKKVGVCYETVLNHINGKIQCFETRRLEEEAYHLHIEEGKSYSEIGMLQCISSNGAKHRVLRYLEKHPEASRVKVKKIKADTCPECGAKVRKKDKYCWRCGKKI